MDRESVEIYREKIKKGSIKRNCREAVELEEKEGFSIREKHKEMNATSKLLKQRSNQHVKLLKHLSTCMQSIHRSKKKKKNTHTHTHTKQI